MNRATERRQQVPQARIPFILFFFITIKMAYYKKGYKKTYKKPYRKRYYKKYAKKGSTKNSVNTLKSGGFSDSYWTPFKTITSGLSLGDSTNPGYQRVRFLSDPTFNNTNTPMGWDILTLAYDVYLVHMMKIKVTFLNTSSVPCKVFIGCIDLDNNNLPSSATGLTQTQVNSLCETPYCKIAYLSAAGGGRDTTTVKLVIKVAKFHAAGARKITPAHERYLGNTGSSNSTQSFSQPTNNALVHYGAITSSNAALATNSIYVNAEWTWYTQLTERLGYAV